MSPEYEVNFGDLPREVKQNLSKAEKSRLFNHGGFIIRNDGNKSLICRDLPVDDYTRCQIEESDIRDLFIVSPKKNPEKNLEIQEKIFTGREGKLTGHRPLYRGKHRSHTRGTGMMSIWRKK